MASTMGRLTVLGLGNILMQDDGVGVRLLEAVQPARPWPAEVEFVDGGAGGLRLMEVIEEADRLVVLDAADVGLPAGQCRVVRPDQLQEDALPDRVSLHDMSFLETLRLCRQFARCPREVHILAIQPKVVDHGRRLSPELQGAMDRLVDAATRLIAQVAAR